MLEFMRDQREEAVMFAAVRIERDDNAQVPVALCCGDEWQKTPIHMAEGTNAELHIHEADHVVNGIDQRTECRRSFRPFPEQFEDRRVC